MEVAGGGVDVAVPEQLGEGGEVGAGLEFQRREGVTEGVGRRLLREPQGLAQGLDAPLDGAHREAGSAPGDEERALPFLREGVPLREPGSDEGEGAIVQRDLAHGAALARDVEERRALEVDLAHVEPHELVHAEPGLGEQREDREVRRAFGGARPERERAEASLELVDGEHGRHAARLADEGDVARRVDRRPQLGAGEGEEHPQRGELLVARRGRANAAVEAPPPEEALDLDTRGEDLAVRGAREEREERLHDRGVRADRAERTDLRGEVTAEAFQQGGHRRRVTLPP